MSEKASEEVRPVTGMSRSTAVFFSTEPKTEPKPRLVMKPITSFALLAAIAATIGAANAAATDPVGYITTTINANVSGTPAGSATFVAPSLVAPSDFAGASTASPSGGTTITFASGVPVGLDGASMLEITSGASEGWWTTVVSSTATTITVADAFPAGLAANTSVAVRKFNTLDSVFGANNSAGLTPFNGTTPADEIQILDPVTQAATAYIYVGGAWTNIVTEEPSGSAIIHPGTSVLVIHHANTALSLVTSGSVKTTKTQVDVYPSDNWLGQPNPTGGTLGTLTLAPQILTNDNVLLTRPDPGTGQPTDTFVAVAGTMYNAVTEEPSDSEPVVEGSGYVLRRLPADAASTITIPAQLIAQ
ncbi:hypothetical protein OJ996_06065 [Luteolibacter sp. GHJ8]|uniref:Uncharacterized protein n=1 Tax=Luteolibacter rhizosphaerae TaxID=2989719 RepID=A0ABT3G0D2_9BACT|nr:hypothetical protein [Luteolibacter rhizosphaerae]MCW1913127.1 hypothetical protein [Luteolibacter rhizosphaerae]